VGLAQCLPDLLTDVLQKRVDVPILLGHSFREKLGLGIDEAAELEP
jgi:hypothetical protein